MPSIQTSYTPVLAPAFAGMVADMRNRTVVSKTMASATAMAFGAVALRGASGAANDESVLNVGDTGAGAFKGIAILDPTVRPTNVQNTYAQYDTAAILEKGIVWVTVSGAVTPGAPAYYTSGGAITATSTSNTAIPNAVFESTTSGAGLAKLRL